MKRTKDNIFEAAIRVFSKSGYDSATMDEVAKEAGVAKGTLYYHFNSKESLFYFVVQRGIDLIKTDIEDTVKEIKDPVERIKTMLRVQLEYVYENKDLFRVIISHIWGKENQHDEIREQIKGLINMNSAMIDKNIAGGKLLNYDNDIFGYYFMGVLISVVLYEIINDENDKTDKAIEKIISYIGHGVNYQN